jgi:hypothetical protein
MKNSLLYGAYTATGADHQRGIVTTFTGVLILVLLTLMMFFAVRVGVFDQRNSSNDMRQKLAFHMAESGIHEAKEFFRANSIIAASPTENILPNGTDGWLSKRHGALRWQKCSDAGLNLATGSGPPCFGEAIRAGQPLISLLTVPQDAGRYRQDTGTTETVAVQALLCLLDIDYDQAIPVQGCSTNPRMTRSDFVTAALLDHPVGAWSRCCVGTD